MCRDDIDDEICVMERIATKFNFIRLPYYPVTIQIPEPLAELYSEELRNINAPANIMNINQNSNEINSNEINSNEINSNEINSNEINSNE